MSERLGHLDILRFAYGEADELEDTIMGDPEYLAALEEIWASELPSDMRSPVLRAIQMERLVSGTIGVTIDLAIDFWKAIPHYMASDGDDDPEEPQPPKA